MTPRERTQAVFQRRIPDRLQKEIKLTPALLDAFERERRERGTKTSPGTTGSTRARSTSRNRVQCPTLLGLLPGRSASAVESRRLGGRRVGSRLDARKRAAFSSTSSTRCCTSTASKTSSATRSPTTLSPEALAASQGRSGGVSRAGLFASASSSRTVSRDSVAHARHGQFLADIMFDGCARYLTGRRADLR